MTIDPTLAIGLAVTGSLGMVCMVVFAALWLRADRQLVHAREVDVIRSKPIACKFCAGPLRPVGYAGRCTRCDWVY